MDPCAFGRGSVYTPGPMLHRFLNRVRFQVGQLLVRGLFSRLLVVGGMVVLVALAGGLAARLAAPEAFEGTDGAVWWAFLRLSDPGYLGDDHGVALRTVSTVLTLLGYVVFLGALVAVMTQALVTGMRRLESGLTPIAAQGHVLIAGWTDRTVDILREMFQRAEHEHGWLGARTAGISAVVLAEHANAELHQTLRERLGRHFNEREIVLRQGEPIYLDHLQRADFANAATIVLPGDPFLEEGTDHSDARNIKSLLSIGRRLREQGKDGHRPLMVVELFDERRVPAAIAGYTGPLEIVATGQLQAGMLAQALRYPGLARGFREVLTAHDGGPRLRAVPAPESLVGTAYGEALLRGEDSALIGIVRDRIARVLPSDLVISDQDQIITFGAPESYTLGPEADALEPVERPVLARPIRRLLILGWSYRVPRVLAHLASLVSEPMEVAILSFVPVEERTRVSISDPQGILRITHHHGDFTIPEPIRQLAPETYDAMLMIASDRLESGAESDARTVAAHAVLRHCLAGRRWPHTVVELMDGENAPLLEGTPVEHLVPPTLIGRILAAIARMPRLRRAFDVLLSPGETELVVVPSDHYAPLPEGTSLRRRILAAGHVPLGMLLAGAEGIAPIGDDPAPSDALLLVIVPV